MPGVDVHWAAWCKSLEFGYGVRIKLSGRVGEDDKALASDATQGFPKLWLP